jgi:hypoxanthine phosphoribosyltransferase
MSNMFAKEDMAKILFSEQEIQTRVKELAKQISDDYRGLDPVFIGVLRGAVIFYTDLIKCTDIHMEMNFLAISSYGDGIESSGEVRIQYDMQESIKGRHVVVIEDIIDTGLTISHLKEILAARHPASVKVCTLLDKPSRRKVEVTGDYVGFEVPNEFVVGYGLDYAGKYRNLNYIGVLKPTVYE